MNRSPNDMAADEMFAADRSMTHPQAVTPELLAVTQTDREAAAEALWLTARAGDSIPAVEEWHHVKSGQDDGHRLVQAFARHRLGERERCAIIADDGCDNAGDESEQRMARQIAIAIRETTDVE